MLDTRKRQVTFVSSGINEENTTYKVLKTLLVGFGKSENSYLF